MAQGAGVSATLVHSSFVSASWMSFSFCVSSALVASSSSSTGALRSRARAKQTSHAKCAAEVRV